VSVIAEEAHRSLITASRERYTSENVMVSLVRFILRLRQNNDDYMDGRSQILDHTDERTQVNSVRYSLDQSSISDFFLPVPVMAVGMF